MSNGPTSRDVEIAEALKELLQEIQAESEETAKAYSALGAAVAGTSRQFEYESRAIAELIKGKEREVAAISKEIEANRGNQEAVASLSQELQRAVNELEEYGRALENATTLNRAASDAVDMLQGSLGIATDSTSNFVFQFGALAAKLVQGTGAMRKSEVAVKATGMAFNTVSNYMEQGFLVVLGRAWQQINQLDQAAVNFTRTMGMAEDAVEQYTNDMNTLYRSALKAGVSVETLGDSYTELYTTMTNFSAMSRQMQSALVETASLLERTGVGANSLAQSGEVLNRVLGQTGSQVAAAQRELYNFAGALGRPPAIVQQEWAEMAMDFTVYGNKMQSTFMRLQTAAKDTGLSMSQLMSVTAQFDTFEGAAEAAGRLNAVLGRDLFNSLDMLLTTDPYSRFRKLREGILEAAGAFEQMEYYEKRAIASAAGLEGVGELAMLMSGKLERAKLMTAEYSMTAEQLAQRQMNMMSLQEQFQATLSELAPDLMWVLRSLKGWLQNFREMIPKIKEFGTEIMVLYGAFKTVGAIIPAIQTGLMGMQAAAAATSTAMTGLSMAITASGIGLVVALGALAYTMFSKRNSPTLDEGFEQWPGKVNRVSGAMGGMAGSAMQASAALGQLGQAQGVALSVVDKFGRVDTSKIDRIAGSIRNIAHAINAVDTSKSMQFNASLNLMASAQMSQLVASAVQLRRDDVQLVTDIVEQARKLSTASTTANEDQLRALIGSVSQLVRTVQVSSAAGGGGGGYSGPSTVEATLKLDGYVLDTHILRLVRAELARQTS